MLLQPPRAEPGCRSNEAIGSSQGLAPTAGSLSVPSHLVPLRAVAPRWLLLLAVVLCAVVDVYVLDAVTDPGVQPGPGHNTRTDTGAAQHGTTCLNTEGGSGAEGVELGPAHSRGTRHSIAWHICLDRQGSWELIQVFRFALVKGIPGHGMSQHRQCWAAQHGTTLHGSVLLEPLPVVSLALPQHGHSTALHAPESAC